VVLCLSSVCASPSRTGCKARHPGVAIIAFAFDWTRSHFSCAQWYRSSLSHVQGFVALLTFVVFLAFFSFGPQIPSPLPSVDALLSVAERTVIERVVGVLLQCFSLLLLSACDCRTKDRASVVVCMIFMIHLLTDRVGLGAGFTSYQTANAVDYCGTGKSPR
jgi:hypothetical protein